MTVTLESMLISLSRSEKLDAMELLWRDLSRDPSQFTSPEWHGQVLAERLAMPADAPRLSIDDARQEVRERLDARRTKG